MTDPWNPDQYGKVLRDDETAHPVAEEPIATEPYRSAGGGWRKPQPVLTPDAYARLLSRLGFVDPVVRLIVYPHVLAGPAGPFFFRFKRILMWGKRA